MKITTTRFYGGSREKVGRLGVADLYLELQQILFDADVEIQETAKGNGAAEVRAVIDGQFKAHQDWVNTASGGVDWVKRARYNQTILVRLGVEIQVSSRSDLLIRDVVHLRNSLQKGDIDVGAIVVPSDRFQLFLPDRTPSLRDAVRYIEEEFREATTYPIVVIAVEHDRVGGALPKRRTNVGKAVTTPEAEAQTEVDEMQPDSGQTPE